MGTLSQRRLWWIAPSPADPAVGNPAGGSGSFQAVTPAHSRHFQHPWSSPNLSEITGTDFAFETTLSGLVYLARLKRWKSTGYRVEILYLRLSSPKLALRRVAARVRQGGHHVPRADVLRRYERGWNNFQSDYRDLADAWAVYDNSGDKPQLIERKS